ncbi:hypothetical protein CEXT_476591 [Caerostris extrusa]|uniref:Uncharacterized protein n=1 Tax=Caerostris extrusa TaxID=172846 RepID=A0AAV4P1W8_CAEEX|nr:hypothetical protein CEXT_476591 [Caerostris extrusa]
MESRQLSREDKLINMNWDLQIRALTVISHWRDLRRRRVPNVPELCGRIRAVVRAFSIFSRNLDRPEAKI